MSKYPPIEWTGPGCPLHKGGPGEAVLRAIFAHTEKDRNDRLYYRKKIGDGVRRLDGKDQTAAYAELNRIIDRYR